MSNTSDPSRYVQTTSFGRGSAIVLIGGFGLSLIAHLGIGYGASEYFARTRVLDKESEKQIEIQTQTQSLSPVPDEVRLGLDESKVASINWLGVLEDQQVGDVHESLVEQAEFTKQLGDAPITRVPEPRIELKPEVVEQVIDQVDEQLKEEPLEDPAEEPKDSSREQMELEIQDEVNDATVIVTQPEPIETPVETPTQEPTQKPVTEPDEDVKPTPEPVEPKPADPTSAKPTPPKADPAPETQEVTPTTTGKAGVVSPKESAASKVKRALKVDGRVLHRPIAGPGIEIHTVEPRFPASVRFTELPRNPVVLIEFDASGKVRKASFLRDATKTYDTGVKGVDEPLLNAIYKWRAKGKEIDALDLNDPKSLIEISMRITFRKDRKEP